MPTSLTDRYNLVVLPLADAPNGMGRFQLSASCPGVKRMISPAWSEAESRAAFLACGVEAARIGELFRGNSRMCGWRGQHKLFFREQQLLDMGLVEVVPAR